MVRPWRPKRSRRNAQRAPGRTGPGCVMRGPLLVLGWPELSELEGCVGCRALAEHGLRSCQQTRLCGYASATGASTQGRMSLPTGQGRGHVTCWTELVGYVRWDGGRRAVGSVEVNGIRTGRAVRGQARGGCALRAVMRFALDREPTVVETVNSRTRWPHENRGVFGVLPSIGLLAVSDVGKTAL